MPPSGESVGFALEDVTLFHSYPRSACRRADLKIYEDLRRNTIDDAYQEAEYRWDGIRDKGWFALKSRECTYLSLVDEECSGGCMGT
jgi:hypothetical protein